MEALSLAFEVTWDPGIRGILVVVTGVGVLMGSVYLLLATNVGARLGFLIALTGFWGWIAIMGLIWWVYGIGYVGESPSWKVREVNVAEVGADPHKLENVGTDEAADLTTWDEIPAGDPSRGEAQAAADEALTGEDSPVAMFEESTEYVTTDAFAKGGKDPDNFIYSWVPLLPNPTRYATIQVQQAIKTQAIEEGDECPADTECFPLGETPPKSEADEDQPVVSVIMVRDLGSKRLPPALITFASLLMFGVLCNVLHRRDKEAAAARAGVKAES